MSGPNDFQDIAAAILRQTQDDTVVIAMLVGAGLESDWRIDAAGGGAFQIIDPGRPAAPLPPAFGFGTAAPGQIDADVGYMLPRYQTAASKHAKDPESADKYANIAHDAERPALPYQQSQGEAKVNSVYHTVVVNYGMGGAGAGGPGSVVSTNPFQAVIGPVTDFLSRLTDVRMWRSVGWLTLGVAVMVLAVVVWFRKPLTEAATTVASTAGKAATA
jgi:hypothetical protein